MSTSLPGWIIGTQRQGNVIYIHQVISLDCLARDSGLSNNFNCDRTQQTSKDEGCNIARRLMWSEGSQIRSTFRQDDFVEIKGTYIDYLTSTSAMV